MIFEGGRELFNLDPDVSHLNHGSFGSIPRSVREVHRALLDEVDLNQMQFARSMPERVAAVRDRLARYLGADPAGAAFVANATTGIAHVLHTLTVAPSLRPGSPGPGSLRPGSLRPGDEILVNDHTYSGVRIGLGRFARRTGVVIREVHIPLDASDEATVALLMEGVRPTTRLAIVDQIPAATAKLFPVAAIVAAMRTAGVPVLVDAAHVPGMIDADVDAIGADFWVGNFHKWGLAPRATALLCVAPQWRDRMEPLVPTYGDLYGYPMSVEHQGTRDVTPWLAAPAGLDLLAALGPEGLAHNVAVADLGQRLVGSAIGAPTLPHSGDGVSLRVVPLPPGLVVDDASATAWRTRIAEELRVETNVNPFTGTGGLLRISGQVYVSSDDVQRLADGLPGLLATRAA
jgi:isopenicillin-N epimerase